MPKLVFKYSHRIFEYIRIYSNDIHIYAQSTHYDDLLGGTCIDQRTNGPVNAHLRSAVYTNVIENSPSIGADKALGPFFFSE